MGNVIRLRPEMAAKRKPRPEPSRAQILARIRSQSARVCELNDWHGADDLGMLAYLARNAGDRIRSISWRGIRFPVTAGFVIRSVRCPETGMALVGVVG
jgi:hypothetical protein